MTDVAAGDRGLTRRGRQQCGEHAEGRRLAGAVRAEEGDEFAGGHGEVDGADYTDAAGEATARVVEPYRLVPVARRWYLLAWDRQRDDWRTFRLDRIADVFPTRVRFEPRPMSDEGARTRVERALRYRERTVSCTRRPTCTRSGTPASRSSRLSCCDTDDGL
ncbi:hypothetical protein GCM10023152_17000 [Agromyces bauzanensis]|uniref:WYL domain-containing protein n=1 Tax=Agromyces bauzanensis TaxID=1308924 RepID=A0A917PTZ5_9MICO|nr:hypothetical protein GCM10011372_32180 [Agromyces bauzanensis]